MKTIKKKNIYSRKKNIYSRKKNIYSRKKNIYSRKKNIYSRKKKGGYTRIMKEKIESINNQNQLACSLREDNVLKNFSIEIFWNLLNLVKKIHPTQYKVKIKQSITIKKNEQNVVTSIGFEANELDQILDSLENKLFGRFIQIGVLYSKPHAVSAALTLLNNENYQAEYIIHDEFLFNEFIKKLKIIFCLPDNFTDESFKNLYEEATKIEDKNKKEKTIRSFNMLIVKIMHTDNDIKSVINKNYGREIFTRNPVSSDHQKTPINISETYKCFDDIKGNEIYDVSSYLDLNNIFIEYLFKSYDRILIGGISGSVYYLYFMVFHILRDKYKKTDALLLKLLSIAVMDYVPLWHSLEEILLTYSVLLNHEDKKYNIYKLDEDPLDYYKNLFSIF